MVQNDAEAATVSMKNIIINDLAIGVNLFGPWMKPGIMHGVTDYPHVAASSPPLVDSTPRPLTGRGLCPQLHAPGVISRMSRTGTKPVYPQGSPMRPILLASSSSIRAALLRNAGLTITTHPARIDEETIRAALESEGATPRDIADTLAEMKAARVAARHPQDMVIGCDQVLEFQGRAFGKPDSADTLRAQLETLRGQTHRLLSALVVYHQGQPVWRHVGVARLTMRAVSDAYLFDYLDRHATDLMDSVGGYKLESEGVRLFSQIEGDYFTILGLPLLPLLSWLAQRGDIPS